MLGVKVLNFPRGFFVDGEPLELANLGGNWTRKDRLVDLSLLQYQHGIAEVQFLSQGQNFFAVFCPFLIPALANGINRLSEGGLLGAVLIGVLRCQTVEVAQQGGLGLLEVVLRGTDLLPLFLIVLVSRPHGPGIGLGDDRVAATTDFAGQSVSFFADVAREECEAQWHDVLITIEFLFLLHAAGGVVTEEALRIVADEVAGQLECFLAVFRLDLAIKVELQIQIVLPFLVGTDLLRQIERLGFIRRLEIVFVYLHDEPGYYAAEDGNDQEQKDDGDLTSAAAALWG